MDSFEVVRVWRVEGNNEGERYRDEWRGGSVGGADQANKNSIDVKINTHSNGRYSGRRHVRFVYKQRSTFEPHFDLNALTNSRAYYKKAFGYLIT